MKRTHVAKSGDVIQLRRRRQLADEYTEVPMAKPRGLWYQIDGDWERWVRDEGLDWLVGAYLHDLQLDGESILALRSAADLDRFTREYGSPTDYGSPFIRWGDVAECYDGIEVAPYVWTRRLALLWYYGWDCASGCLWRPRGARLTPIGPLDQGEPNP